MVRTIFFILALTITAPAVAVENKVVSSSTISATTQTNVDATTNGDEASLFSWEYWGYGSGATRSEIFRNLGLAGIAFIGVVFGIWRTFTAHQQAKTSVRQADIAQQGHITDRYSKAVEQLGSDNVTVRIGGIYALKRIAQDSMVRDHISVMDVFTNFIRFSPYAKQQREAVDAASKCHEYIETCKRNPEYGNVTEAPEHPRLIDCPDIIAAIDTIRTRSEDQKSFEASHKYFPTLKDADFSYLILNDVDLSGFNLNGVALKDANVIGINLSNVDLSGYDLQNIDLSTAILTDINLSGSDMDGSVLMDAKLNRSKLIETRLVYAMLDGADLKNADLTRADLTSANLTNADLTGADLTDATLTRSNLLNTNLSNANLSNTNLTETNLAASMLSYEDFMEGADSEYANITRDQFRQIKDAPNLSMAFTRTGQPPINLPEGINPPPEKD